MGQWRILRRLGAPSGVGASADCRRASVPGGYFNGQLHSLRTLVQATPDPRIAVSADYTVNRLGSVGVARRSVTTHLLGVEWRLAANPRLQVVNFTQWNTVSRQFSVNARLAWEYRPLAFFAVVYNDRSPVDGRGIEAPALPLSRQLLVKATCLLQL